MIALTTARRASRTGVLWGLVFGGLVAASSVGYATTFPDPEARRTLARSFGSNPGIAALVGPARDLETVAGFTAWRCMGIVTIIGAFVGLLAATRHLRGEEEAGRWELYLSGHTTRAGAALQATIGLGVGVLVLWVVTAMLTLGAGASEDVQFAVTASLFFATALVATTAVYAAVGALASQLAATRRQANVIGGAALGASFVLRMIADATDGLDWLRWLSPLGWAEELRPLTGSRPLWLIPFVVATVGFTAAAVVLAGRRDLGASALPGTEVRAPRTALLAGSTGLSVRLTRPLVLGWILAQAALGFVAGMVSQSASEVVSGSETIERMLARLGGFRTGAAAYLGFALTFSAALVAFSAASQISGVRSEEGDGHLDHLLALPVGRARWLSGRLVIGTATVVVGAVAAGVAAWLGAATQDAGVGFADMFKAGLNIAPPGIFVLGVGAAVYGVLSRPGPVVAYAIVTWSFIVQLIAAFVTSNRLVLDSSLLTHVAPAPATDPDWSSALWLIALGVGAMIAGVFAFRRRDLIA